MISADRTLIVLPAFNEQQSLPAVLAEVSSVMGSADLLVIDDGSTDRTSAAANRAGVDVVTLPFNLGVGGALRAGFRYTVRYGYRQMVQVDADGQHDPREIPNLLRPLDHADTVIGARFAGRGGYEVDRARRLAMSVLARSLSRRTHAVLTDTTSGFRAFGPRAIALFAREYPAEYLGDTVEALPDGCPRESHRRPGSGRDARPNGRDAEPFGHQFSTPARANPSGVRPPTSADTRRAPATGRLMTTQWLAGVGGVLTIMAMIHLLRRQYVKEKYAVLWFLAGISVAVLAIFPQLLDLLADTLHIHSGPNLLFLIAVIALGLVCVHLSIAVSTLEENNRTLAEELGLLKLVVDKSHDQRRLP
jgi:hypothetical protein